MYKALSNQSLFIHNDMTNYVFLIPGPPPYPGSVCRLLCLNKLSIRTGGRRGSQNGFFIWKGISESKNCLGDSWALSVKVGDEFVCTSLCHRLGNSIVPSGSTLALLQLICSQKRWNLLLHKICRVTVLFFSAEHKFSQT